MNPTLRSVIERLTAGESFDVLLTAGEHAWLLRNLPDGAVVTSDTSDHRDVWRWVTVRPCG